MKSCGNPGLRADPPEKDGVQTHGPSVNDRRHSPTLRLAPVFRGQGTGRVRIGSPQPGSACGTWEQQKAQMLLSAAPLPQCRPELHVCNTLVSV